MPFNIGPGELIIVLVIALLVIGPGKLPDVGSALGKSIREFRKAATDVQESVNLDTPPAASTTPASTTPASTTPASTTPAAPAAVVPAAAAVPAPAAVAAPATPAVAAPAAPAEPAPADPASTAPAAAPEDVAQTVS